MRLLLDTNAAIWWAGGDPRLRPDQRLLIQTAASVHVSVASTWEIAIKISVGKPTLDLAGLLAGFAAEQIALLPVSERHCLRFARLPLLHRDPFDRMLVAQALEDGLVLLTSDGTIPRYASLGITVIECG